MNNERPIWIVYVEKFNQNCIEEYNIFDHDLFWDDCCLEWTTAEYFSTTLKSQIEDFNNRIMLEVNYHFGGKSKWEIELTTLFPRDEFKNNRIDVSDQIKLNKKQFLNYLWNWFKERELKKNG